MVMSTLLARKQQVMRGTLDFDSAEGSNRVSSCFEDPLSRKVLLKASVIKKMSDVSYSPVFISVSIFWPELKFI